MEAILDLRCLQDPLFARRGLGRHAEAMLRFAPRDQAVLTGLLDPALPPLPPQVRAMLHGVRHTAYTGALARPACLVSFSPFTHDPLFTARLLHHPAVFGVAVVDGLLPLEEPGRYMPGADARLDHHVSLRWLARNRLFLLTHEAAGAVLERTLGIRPHETVVTGGAAGAAVREGRGARRHVLVVANGDARREPEVAVRAHARSQAMQDGGVPLVVVGALGKAWLHAQQAVGGRAGLVQAPGRVDDTAMAALCRDALCVVAPARADGFPWHAAEAIAAGVPVLASRIPSHAGLVASDALFDVGDDAGLTGLLDRVAGPWRESVLAAQAAVRPQLRLDAVAARFWGAVLDRAAPRAAPSVLRGVRPKLAIVLPAAPTDAAYGRALCRALGRVADVEVSDTALEPASSLPFLSSDYDRVVLFGNAGIAARRHCLRYGGAWLGDLNGALPDGEVAAVAEPVLVHSPAAVRALGGNAAWLPFGFDRAWPPAALKAPARQAARARLPGTEQPGAVLAMFTERAIGEAMQDCVWALELLQSWGVNARLHVLSHIPIADTAYGRLASLLGVDGRLCAFGAGGVEDHLLAADLVLDVRAGVTFEAPLYLPYALGAGLRCVASASLVDAAGAPPHAHAVPDNLSPVRLAEAVLHALDQPPVADTERQAYADSRSMNRTAARLLALLGIGP